MGDTAKTVSEKSPPLSVHSVHLVMTSTSRLSCEEYVSRLCQTTKMHFSGEEISLLWFLTSGLNQLNLNQNQLPHILKSMNKILDSVQTDVD